MVKGVRGSLLAATLLAVTGCAASDRAPQTASDAPAAAPDKKPDRSIGDPYPSTYHPYPAAPTAVRGVTVFDGAGGPIAQGTVLLADGKVERVGGPNQAIPETTHIGNRPYRARVLHYV